MQPTARISKPDRVIVRDVDGESVLLNLETDAFFSLDDVGTRMWSVLTDTDSLEAAYQKLLAAYDVKPEQLRADLDSFVEKLVEAGLIDVA